MSKRVVFLMSDTGGGHRASADALIEALRLLYADAVHCQVVDVLVGYGTWPLNRAPDYYVPLLDRYLWLWRAMFWGSNRKLLWRPVLRAAQVWQASGMQRLADDYPADLYVSVHPMLNHVPQRALRKRYPAARFATVVTDLASAPQVWYSPGVDLLVASCQAVQQAALAAGVAEQRIRLLGLPIRLPFGCVHVDRAQARVQLGLDERPTVLLLGGGAGIGNLDAIAPALADALAHRGGQLTVICGRNQALWARLASRAWPLPTRIAGFVDDMPLWMAAADILVTKAGPGTVAEALASGLPMVLSGFVPGQEAGNVSYVEASGVGVYCSDPSQITAMVTDWLQPDNPLLPAMCVRAKALARPQAAIEIAEALAALL